MQHFRGALFLDMRAPTYQPHYIGICRYLI